METERTKPKNNTYFNEGTGATGTYTLNIDVQFVRDTMNVRPEHNSIHHWLFSEKIGETTNDDTLLAQTCELEANLADAIVRVAIRNGMSVNDVQHLFPAILRMLKSKSDWT